MPHHQLGYRSTPAQPRQLVQCGAALAHTRSQPPPP